jgi:hypothetical protein
MDNLIVGGFLPGTNTQFSFLAWLIVMAAFLSIVLVVRIAYKHLFADNLDGFAFMRVYSPSAQELHLSLDFRTVDLDNFSAHQVLHAVSSSSTARKARSLASNIYLHFQS